MNNLRLLECQFVKCELLVHFVSCSDTKTIVTGFSGQDGFFIAQLLSKGYGVHDVLTRNSLMSGGTMELQPPEMRKQIAIHYGNITDENFLSKLLQNERPK